MNNNLRVAVIAALLTSLIGCSSQPNTSFSTTAAPTAAKSDPASPTSSQTQQTCPPIEKQQCPSPIDKTGQPMDSNKIVIGETERIKVSPPGVALAARIDTGATTTSIDAREIQPFERDGEPWVSFVLVDDKDIQHTLERPVTRIVEIKRHGGDNLERPVIKLQLELAGETLNTEVSLTDRSRFEYGLLIGRNFLKDVFVVDVSKAYSHKTSNTAK